jgi:pimeloyl-ACP methyl ester carboxylesterase
MGKPVLYFHGFPGSRLEVLLGGEANFTRAGIRLLAIDRPGMGRSDFQPGRRFLDWSADISVLLDALDLERVSIVGVSGGAPYALVCALHMPERLDAVVVMSGVGPFDQPGAEQYIPRSSRRIWQVARWLPVLLSLPMRQIASKLARASDPSDYIAYLKQSLPPVDAQLFDDPDRAELIFHAGREAFLQGSRGAAWEARLYARDWGFPLEQINYPITWFHGDQDLSVPVGLARLTADRLPDCRLLILPGEGHFSPAIHHLESILAAIRQGTPEAAGIPSVQVAP